MKREEKIPLKNYAKICKHWNFYPFLTLLVLSTLILLKVDIIVDCRHVKPARKNVIETYFGLGCPKKWPMSIKSNFFDVELFDPFRFWPFGDLLSCNLNPSENR